MGPAAAILSRRSRSSRAGTHVGIRAGTVLAVTAALLLPAAGVAVAGPPGPAAVPVSVSGPTAEAATDAPRVTPGGPHCALEAGPGRTPTCFATFRAAVAYATGGAVTDAPDSPAAAAADPGFTARIESTTSATTLVGFEYADLNWKGSSLSMYASGPCDSSSDADYRFPSLPSGWNDRISSFKSYSNCAQQLFRGTSFSGGSLTLVIANMSYVGSAANDQASSVTFN